MHAEGGTGVHAAPKDPPQERSPGIHAEGGTGVHAAPEAPPQEGAHGMHAEGGTGVHAAPEAPPQEGPLACMPKAVRAFTPPQKLPLKKDLN